jgi:hypothetical protein
MLEGSDMLNIKDGTAQVRFVLPRQAISLLVLRWDAPQSETH